MNSEPMPVIQSAASTFGDNAEMQFATRQLLENGMESKHPDHPEIVRRWEYADRRRFSTIWKTLFIAISLAISVVLCANHAVDFLRVYGFYKSLNWGGTLPEFFKRLDPPPRTDLTESQRYLIGEKHLTSLENAHRLWQTDPENPAYFARYASAFISENRRLPDDFLNTARRLDPENSWFLYQAAGHLADGAVTADTQTNEERRAKARKTWKITNDAKFQESLALFRAAADMPKFDNYEIANIRGKIALMPRDTPLDGFATIAGIAGEISGIIPLRKLLDLCVAEAQRLEKSGDSSGFSAHLDDCEAYIRKLDIEDESTLIYELIFSAIATGLSDQLDASAKTLDPSSNIQPWASWNQQLAARKVRREIGKGFIHSHLPDLERNGGGLVGSTLPMIARQVENAPPMTIEDFTPMREMEHSIFARGAIIMTSLVTMFLLLLVFLSRWKHRLLIRKLAARMELLLRPSDWAWILGFGVLFPVIYVAWITQFSPLGLRHVGLPFLFGGSVFYPYGLMILLSLGGAIVVSSWRVRDRLKAFAPTPSPLRWAWVAMFLIGLVLPWFLGASIHWEKLRDFSSWISDHVSNKLTLPDTIMALWSCVFLLLLICSVFSIGKNALIQATVSRTLTAALAFSIVLMSSSLPWLRASEIRSMKQDTLIMPNPDLPGMTPYEAKVSRQLRKEIREALGTMPN